MAWRWATWLFLLVDGVLLLQWWILLLWDLELILIKITDVNPLWLLSLCACNLGVQVYVRVAWRKSLWRHYSVIDAHVSSFSYEGRVFIFDVGSCFLRQLRYTPYTAFPYIIPTHFFLFHHVKFIHFQKWHWHTSLIAQVLALHLLRWINVVRDNRFLWVNYALLPWFVFPLFDFVDVRQFRHAVIRFHKAYVNDSFLGTFRSCATFVSLDVLLNHLRLYPIVS